VKEAQFKYNRTKVFMKSILIWIVLLMQIGLTYFIIDLNIERSVTALLGASIFFSVITVPGLVLHINHFIRTRNSVFTIRYETVSMKNGKDNITLKSSEISKIILHDGLSEWRLPWWGYGWYELIDTNGNSIKISCYLLEISELWQNSLSRRISSKNMERKWNILPLMKGRTITYAQAPAQNLASNER
jgi:hypothetical protein